MGDSYTISRRATGKYDAGDDGYNWLDEEEGTDEPTGWVNGDTSGPPPFECYSRIVDIYAGHKKVLKQNNHTASHNAELKHTFTAGGQASGFVEYLCAWEDSLDAASEGYSNFAICDNSWTELCHVAIRNGEDAFGILGEVYSKEGVSLRVDLNTHREWIHFMICWDHDGGGYDPKGDADPLGANEYRLYINDVKYGDYALFNNVDAYGIHLYNEVNSSSSGDVYYDAIAFSWDTGYSFGDNKTTIPATTYTSNEVYRFEIEHNIDDFPRAVGLIDENINLYIGDEIEVKDTLLGVDDSIIFEGIVVKKDAKYPPKIWCEGKSNEIDRIRPSGSYTKTTDTLCDDIITNDTDYITNGSTEAGVDLGTFILGGDKTIRRIFNDCAKMDEVIWYVTPEGVFYLESPDTDSTLDLDETDNIWDVVLKNQTKGINKVIVLGGIKSDGTQAIGIYENTHAQTIDGIILYKDTDATLNTDALCESKAEGIFNNIANPPKMIKLLWRDTLTGDYPDTGFLQVGQTLTFSYNKPNIMPVIEEEEYIIYGIKYFLKWGYYQLTIANGLVFKEKTDQESIQENSHLIDQNRENVGTNTTNVATNTTNVATNTSDIANNQGIAYKTADDTISSDSTFSNDSELFFDVEANETYYLEVGIFYQHHPTPDIKVRLDATNNASHLEMMGSRKYISATPFDDGYFIFDAVDWSDQFSLNSGLGSQKMLLLFRGTVEIGGSNDTIYVQWAQRASSAINTTVYRGSYIKWRKV